jgi:ribonuclease HI
MEGALPAKTQDEGVDGAGGLRVSALRRLHLLSRHPQAYRLGVGRAEQEESLNLALLVGGSIVVPHLRRAYELLEEMYG